MGSLRKGLFRSFPYLIQCFEMLCCQKHVQLEDLTFIFKIIIYSIILCLQKTYLYLVFIYKITLPEFKLVKKKQKPLAGRGRRFEGKGGAWKNGITFNVCEKQVWKF